jgi:hypothetical protein
MRFAQRYATRRTAKLGSSVLVLGVAISTFVGSGVADAAVTQLNATPFTQSTVPNSWVKPGTGNVACLTAGTNTSQVPIPGCNLSTPDASGSGALQLTSSAGSVVGTTFYTSSLPTAQGLDVTFNSYQWNGTGADGINFMLAATDPTNPSAPTAAGPLGGSLGYSASPPTVGLPYGYMGFGLDVFGNYPNSTYQGSGCVAYGTAGTPVSNLVATNEYPQNVTVRGPGNGTTGYCILGSSANTNHSSTNNLGNSSYTLDKKSVTTRPAAVPVEIAMNPTGTSSTTASGLTVAADSWLIATTPYGSSQQILTGPLPSYATVTAAGIPASWVDPSTGLPYQLTFGWAASTGGSNEVHEINSEGSTSLTGQLPVWQLGLSDNESQTFLAGNQAAITVSPTLSATEGSESDTVTSTTTFPTGITPGTATGTGWSCTTAGQKVTCSYPPPSAVAAGASLPPITIPVTNSSSATGSKTITSKISSNDSNPANASDAVTFSTYTASRTAASVNYGSSDTLSIAGLPASATGSVTFSSGGTTLCTITDVTAATTCATSTSLPAGSYPVTAAYSGDTHFAPQNATTSFTVAKVASSMTAAVGSNPIAYGTGETLSFSGLPGPATGSVTFTSGGTTLCTVTDVTASSSCTASSTQPVGSYPVTATYSGDGNYNGTTASTSYVVAKAGITLAASVASDPIDYGTAESLSYSGVPSGGTGSVTFTSGGTTLCTVTDVTVATSCSAPSTLAVGSYPVTATYSGDSHYNSATASTSFVVRKASPTLTAAASPSSVSYGTADSLTYGGLPSGATGSVTFTSGGTTLCTVTDVTAATSCNTSATLALGSYPVTATYSGDSHYNTATATTSFSVGQATASGFAASATPSSVSHGTAATLAYSGLPSGATGSVVFTSGGATLCTVTDVTAATSCPTSAGLPAGSYPITATYSGDINYAGTTASTSLVVTPAGATGFSASAVPSSVSYGTAATLAYAGLANDATGTVTFTSGGTTLCTATLPDSSCAAPATLDAATYPVTASYSGDSNHSAVTATTSLTVTPAPSPNFTATAVPASVSYGTPATLAYSGLPSGATGTVTFTSGSRTLCTVTLPASGGCTGPDDLAVGSYPVTAAYSGDADHAAATATTTLTVTRRPTALAAGVSSATVPSGTSDSLSYGNLPSGATGTVTFTAGGRTLCTVTVGSSTKCSTPANLAAGDYHVTATYSGDDNNAGSSDTTDFTVEAVTLKTAKATTTGGTATSIPVDDDNGKGSIAVTTGPGHGTVTIKDGKVVYTPAADYSGGDAFTYTVTHPDGSKTRVTVKVNVAGGSASPTAVPASATTALPNTGAPTFEIVCFGICLAAAGTTIVATAKAPRRARRRGFRAGR